MNCGNCNTQLLIMASVDGFYRYCPCCGERHNIESTPTPAKQEASA